MRPVAFGEVMVRHEPAVSTRLVDLTDRPVHVGGSEAHEVTRITVGQDGRIQR